MSIEQIKPAVRALAPYTLAARVAPVKLNQNENPFEPSGALKQRVIELALARPWARYPDFDPRELREKLAAFAGWRQAGILAGNGSNELIQALLLVTVGPGTRVVIPEPTFTLYALLTKILGGEAVRVPLSANLEYDVAELANARAAGGITIICSPNNPTGGALSVAAVSELCRSGPGLVVIDEAYHEFSGQSVVPLLAEHPNLVVLRTFSKAMALAGLRIGYLLAAEELVSEIDKARLPYNINFFSQAAAIAAIDSYAELRQNIDRLIDARAGLFRALAELPGVRPYPSLANFILIELEHADPRAVFESLYASGVLVRDVTAYPRLSRCLRTSVGSEVENALLLAALRRALAEAR